MSMASRPLVQDAGNMPRRMASGDGFLADPKEQILATNGAGTILAGLLSTGMVQRTTVGAPAVDTTDTAANLDLQFPNMQVGESFMVLYVVDVAFAITIAAGAGVTMKTSGGNAVIAASSSKFLRFEKTGAGAYDLYVC